MCTVTLVALIGEKGRHRGIRLACNRDESRLRPAALPPESRILGARSGLMPVDPASGGTWIGVNDAGLAATLLNVYPPAEDRPVASPVGSGRISRGKIVPRILEAVSVDEALAAAGHFSPRDFQPFRVVVVDERSVGEIRSDGAVLHQLRIEQTGRPLLFTSSGLGDELVAGPRRALFEEMFAGSDPVEQKQRCFHGHSWPDRTHVSVCMRRPEACTVSFTCVDVMPDRVVLSYLPHAPDVDGDCVVATLPRRVG